jgi:hypothetical protein
LNVMGVTVNNQDYFRDSKALQKVILSWTRKHFAWLHGYNPRVAEACLVDGFAYDPDHGHIIKTDPAGLDREPRRVYFPVDAAPAGC